MKDPLNGRVLWKGLPRVVRPRACSGSPYRITCTDKNCKIKSHFCSLWQQWQAGMQ